jgi:hypothetical protein
MSTFITGGSNFPIRSNQKKLDIEHKRLEEFLEKTKKFENNTKLFLIKGNTPEELQPIASGKENTIELLKKKLERLEANHQKSLAVNKILLSKKVSVEEKTELMMKLLPTYSKEKISEMFSIGGGIPSYRLALDNAEMKRLKDRIKSEEKRLEKQNDDTVLKEFQLGEAKVVNNFAENRVQLFFDGKPSETIRTGLKVLGFKWSPSSGAWQTFLNSFSSYKSQKLKALLTKQSET